ncbi:RBP11-like subunits of RNA polymerase [Pyrenochaeta sp. DS3sAY3a]|nr:RBP11-like subunits of RNA polymerase [Pyrenochaeta sp. DS3sAY3a]
MASNPGSPPTYTAGNKTAWDYARGARSREDTYIEAQSRKPKVAFKTNGVRDRFELFLLDEGQKKVEWKEETRVPNTAIFTFNKEDHTLGNLLSQRLLKYDYVSFAAYKVPHPLFATFELRVQTDGTITPKEAIVRACRDIVQDLQRLNDSFQTEWLGKKIVSEGEAERVAREQNNF